MSNEWKRSTWSFRPQAPVIGLSHTYGHIIRALHTALIDAGWVLANWSNGGAVSLTDNYYLRPERFRIDFVSTKYGPSGNQTITVSGAAITKGDMAGGAFGADESTKAAGWVQFSALPTDGDTVTITDGITTKVFEFETTGGVTAGRIAVVIGDTIENTIENFAAAVATVSGFNLVATPHWHWWYTGDNYYQHCGLHVKYNSAGPNIQVGSFLENNTKTGAQRSTNTSLPMTIAYDVVKQNDFLFICGEDGIYVEGGTDSNYNNVAHFFVAAYYPDETMFGTRDRERTWGAQGIAFELRGNVRSYDRNYRFVETVGDRKHHTGRVVGMIARGTANCASRSPSDDRDMLIGPREHWLTPVNFHNTTGNTEWMTTFQATLGLFQSNFDDLYRVSHLAANHAGGYYTGQNTSSSTNVGVLTTEYMAMYDIRNGLRHIPKFGVCSSYLLPWNTIVDKRTRLTYRVARVTDGGRNPNIVVVWPDNSNVTTIPASP